MWYASLIDKKIIPDALVRMKIRSLLKQRIHDESIEDKENQHGKLMDLVNELKSSAIAINTQDANAQHYELPTEFFKIVLGTHLKYSSGYWNKGVTEIDHSELDMLNLTCERAEIQNGMSILELGCGWGSLSLHMAKSYPESKIVSVSNSKTQKIWIDSQIEKFGIANLEIITSDMNDFSTDKKFDRVVSVEMFEHMRNYKLLLAKINRFLNDKGKLFVHIFTHKELAYKFEVKDASDWMSKYFFTGGLMPSDNLLSYFNNDMKVEKHWRVNGTHYEKTSNAWLKKMDDNKAKIMPIMQNTYGKEDAVKWWVFWRLFFMACAELFGYKNGNEWMVSHYLFTKTN